MSDGDQNFAVCSKCGYLVTQGLGCKCPPAESTVLVRERKDEPGKTYDAGKLRFDLIPPEWERVLAEVMTMGAKKYEDHNWEKGLSWSRRYGSVRRHLNAFWAGEDFDKESGLQHLAHAAWGCLALLTFMKTHPEFDDRVKEIQK
jgi:hypothetical protein